MTVRQTLKQFAIEIGILAFVAMCGVIVPTYLSDAHSQGIAQPPAPVVAPRPRPSRTRPTLPTGSCSKSC